MRDRDDFGLPEQRASTGLPLSIMLLSMLRIGLYLVVGGALVQNERAEVSRFTSLLCRSRGKTAREPFFKEKAIFSGASNRVSIGVLSRVSP